MKIKNKDLKNLYRAHILENFPSSRKHCPSFKKIIGSFNHKSSEKQKTKILDHITTCHYCYKEFEFIMQILRNDGKINKNIRNFHLSNKEMAFIKKRAANSLCDLKKRKELFFPILSWKYSSLFLAGILITIILIILFKTNSLQLIEVHNQRGATISRIKLFKPVGARYSKSSLSFEWSELKESNYYILEMFDETLAPFWRSNKIFHHQYAPPKELIENLSKNRTYFWMVTAFYLNGKKVESPLVEFFLIDK